jgi:hypothetical protein
LGETKMYGAHFCLDTCLYGYMGICVHDMYTIVSTVGV